GRTTSQPLPRLTLTTTFWLLKTMTTFLSSVRHDQRPHRNRRLHPSLDGAPQRPARVRDLLPFCGSLTRPRLHGRVPGFFIPPCRFSAKRPGTEPGPDWAPGRHPPA